MARLSLLTLLVAAAFVGCNSDATATPKDSSTSPAVAPPPPPDTALAPGMVSAAKVGVFTAAQAERGELDWTASCGRCHSVTQHSGAQFAAGWNHRKVSELYERVVTTMPQDEPGALSEDQYADIVAYVLKLNGMPAGKKPLPPDPAELRKIRIDIAH
jgi:mono/diheme cytochrome c family protein